MTKLSSLTLAILLTFNLTACFDNDDSNSTSNNTEPPTTPKPETPDQEVPVPKIYLDEHFDQITALPPTWTTLRSNPGTVEIKEGSLWLDGRANDTQMTTLMLSPEFQQLRNYRIDIEFSYLERNNGGRWGSIIYRAADNYAEPAFTPYYQFAIRADATTASGLELALRQPTNAWNVLHKSSYKENMEINQVHKATVVVYGQRVRHYIDDNLVLDTTLPYNLNQGGIGLSTAGLLMKVDSIKISEQLEALPESNRVTDLIDHQLPVSMAPTLIQPIPSTGMASPTAAHVAYQLDEQLNLRDTQQKTISTLSDYLKDSTRRSIPLFTIQSEKTIENLKDLSDQYDLSDITLLSDQTELLRKARIALPMIRTALDYSKHTGLSNSRQDIVTIAHNTNTSLSKIVILPPHLLQPDVVSHLQRLLITPWASIENVNYLTAAQILSSGVNGIYSNQPEIFQTLMKMMAPNTLLRKPLITGHRGIPALEDENTLEGMLKAIQVGADAIEYDVYLSKDNHVVIMHDATTTRTTGVNRNIEEMTLAEIQNLRTIPNGRKVPTMAEVLATVKNYPNITHFIEIKSAKPEIVEKIKALLDQYNAYDQAIVISFNGNQLLQMKNILPGVSTGFLTSTPSAQSNIVNTRRILDATQKYFSTFNPSFAGLNKELMHMASQRGVTFWPWTFRLNKDDFNRMYVQGTHGLTTDYSHDAANFVVKLHTANQIKATVGQPLEIKGEIETQVGKKSPYTVKNMLVLPNSAAHTSSGQTIRFTEKGTAYVLPSYQYNIAPNYSYTIYAQPVTVNIQ
ncbi:MULTISPECIES: glycerophosphodiester phosphodiesterase family protein [unclassified Acinetobacter]|uniref:glycerophosphodiester phosphodiesterase family protein n=1 Tax=unclassified Acinetobacter TaxID=196816 RepID=UPI002934B1CA|nr:MULTISPECIES: glycerophosphodiester phosphodiesterase family protein [unclassified Acinetobacter]WOE32692.1 glycerophosphodiester phosphodiesterase family protein [Acinetobacter sp. SAAs470]WOE38168.1 glycerophosphodiester phosphodiesterase family protein [Acinetobacter sp. SAAs474]